MKMKMSKGVLSKGGTPWAPGTIHAVSNGWNKPCVFSMKSLILLILDKRVESISVIDEDNNQFDLTELRS